MSEYTKWLDSLKFGDRIIIEGKPGKHWVLGRTLSGNIITADHVFNKTTGKQLTMYPETAKKIMPYVKEDKKK